MRLTLVLSLSAANNAAQAVPIEWYRDFCSEEKGMTTDVMAELLSAANYMVIEPLLDLLCLKYTFLLVGKSQDEVRRQRPFPFPPSLRRSLPHSQAFSHF